MNGSWLRQGCGGFVHVVPKNVHCHICHSHGEVGEKNWTRIPLIVARLVFGDSIWAPWRNTGHSGVSGIALWLRAAISYGSGLQLCDSHLPQKSSHQVSKRYVQAFSLRNWPILGQFGDLGMLIPNKMY